MKLFFALALISLDALSYPIFFKCDAEGRMSDQLTPPELSQKLSQMFTSLKEKSEPARTQEIQKICDSGALCMRELNQLLQMAEAVGSVSDEVIKAEIATIQDRAKKNSGTLSELVKIPEGLFQSAFEKQSAIENLALANECRISTTKIDPYLSTNNDTCALANFNQSPYMYPSGIRFSGTNNMTGDQFNSVPRCSEIDEMILSSIATGHDPYATLAISLMENGSDIGNLGLDPIGVVQTLGCPTTRGSSTNHNLDSYGTYYNVRWGTQANPALTQKFNDYAKSKQMPLEKGKSYFCFSDVYKDADEAAEQEWDAANLEGGRAFVTEMRPSGNLCCSELPYSKNSLQELNARTILNYTSFDKYIREPLPASISHPDPLEQMARRLQRFNGYSDSMGGAESVSAWRSGVNYFKTPAYGYQAMDFVLNTLWNNPYVRNKVEEAEKGLGQKSKSILCLNQPLGVYAIEHDIFFQRHAKAPRMESIKQRWDQHRIFSRLPKRDQNVLRGELDAVCESPNRIASFCSQLNVEEQIRKLMRDLDVKFYEKKEISFEEYGYQFEEIQAKQKQLTESINYESIMSEYWTQIYPTRKTVSAANSQDQGFTWQPTDAESFNLFLNKYKENLTRLASEEKAAEVNLEEVNIDDDEIENSYEEAEKN